MIPITKWTRPFITLSLAQLCLSCTPSTPGGIHVSPATQVQTAGNNASLHSEALNHSIKAVTTLNLSGTAGTIVAFTVFLLLILVVYKRLSVFVHLLNERLHGIGRLIGVDGFRHTEPAINVTPPPTEAYVTTPTTETSA